MSTVHVYLLCCLFVASYGSGQMGRYFIFQVPYLNKVSLSVQLYTSSAVPGRILLFVSRFPRKEVCNVTVTRSQPNYCQIKQTHRQNYTYPIWTFVLESSANFGATVSILSSGLVLDIMLLFPVSRFGHNYYVITPAGKPSFIIVASYNNTSVSVRLVNAGLASQPILANGRNYTNNDLMDLLLNSEQGFMIQRCNHHGSEDFTEMLEPDNQYGMEFIIVNLSNQDIEVIVMTTVQSTRLNLTLQEQTLSLVVKESGRISKVNMTQGDSGFMLSDRPIICYLLYVQSCRHKDTALYPWLTTVQPNALFHDTYIWTIRDDKEISGWFHNFVTFIIQTDHADQLTLDGRVLSSSTVWSYVGRSKKWTNTKLSHVSNGTHEARTVRGALFACYVSTVHNREHLVQGLSLKAEWSTWDDWECQQRCGPSKFVRTRSCESDIDLYMTGTLCPGNSTDTKPGNCIVHSICPQDCPNGTFGMDCLGNCRHCINGCNKYNGSCERCLPGWQGDKYGCNVQCPKWTYGFSCEGLCETKCAGLDCLERELGTCPETTSVLPILVFMTLIPYIIFVIFFFSRPKSRKRLKNKKTHRQGKQLPKTAKQIRKHFTDSSV
ncbi:uncharacterized protein LOC106061805 isoform X2 [Biomphalaria glabrata]|uniref:Uncharacterized protein LOC106061805 isoform X2 n=1 Tax=Biomphalaria glabrata TaxID=6526 RepID=A0A9W2ZEJ3_BIOGL|nr:uncharacterized protein LOC106061805 isoform X2 [Biomphalaria glabrata]